MTGAIYAIILFVAGFAGLFGVIWLISPKALRVRPNGKHDPHILGAEMQSGRGGHATVWSVPSDSQEYAKIWSDDLK